MNVGPGAIFFLRENKICIVASPPSQLGSVLGEMYPGRATGKCTYFHHVANVRARSGVTKDHALGRLLNKCLTVTSYKAWAFGAEN